MQNQNPFKAILQYSSSHKRGIIMLFCIIITLQMIYFFADFSSPEKKSTQKQQWLSLQTKIDSLKLENASLQPKIYPFNPNFITDFKGYKLGMSVAEIDRLLAFRKTNKYVNSAKDFQAVTKISDSLLNAIAPYFKFPDWVNNKTVNNENKYKSFENEKFNEKEKISIFDINQASKEDLMKIYGVGEALSTRILNEKLKFGNFVSMDQIKDIWGLSPEVVENLNKYFVVSGQQKINKIKINEASIKELMQLPYFKYTLAKNILTYRSMNGNLNITNLTNVEGFPVDKLKIIALYLEF